MTEQPLASYRLVLVRTAFPGNLGACGRAASNFDVRDTVLVSAFASVQHSEAKRYATNAARDYMDLFKTSNSLQETVKDGTAAIGFSVRTGTTRCATINLNEIPKLLQTQEQQLSSQPARVALIFGNEQDGLSGEELLHCTHVCQIPTSVVHPSLNLSHAVALVLARLYDIHTQQTDKPTAISSVAHNDSLANPLEKLISLDQWEALMARYEKLMGRLGPYDEDDPERVTLHLRRILGRAQLRTGELNALTTLIERLERNLK